MNIVKYIFLICIFFGSNIHAQVSNTELNNILIQTFTNLSSVSSVSYDVTITTLEANKITNTYKATVEEVWQPNSYYALYKISPNHLLFVYNNSSGIERFWFGRDDDLPEIKLKDLDTTLLNTAISYSNFTINPLWLSIPIDNKIDQGFFVIQSYNKNKYSIYSKIEYYINKDKVPVRILYYNNISNFPISEVLITDYKKVNQSYIIYKIEYRDNTTKKVTILEKSNVKVNPNLPSWLEDAKTLINNNLNVYSNYFLMTIRNDTDVFKLIQKESVLPKIVKDVDSNSLNLNSLEESDTLVKDNKKNNNLFLNEDNTFSTNNNVLDKNNENDNLLKALNNTEVEDEVSEKNIPIVPNKDSLVKKEINKPVNKKIINDKTSSKNTVTNKPKKSTNTQNLKAKKPAEKQDKTVIHKTKPANKVENKNLESPTPLPLDKESSSTTFPKESRDTVINEFPLKDDSLPDTLPKESTTKKLNKRRNTLNNLF